jgi:hypothetical protein
MKGTNGKAQMEHKEDKHKWRSTNWEEQIEKNKKKEGGRIELGVLFFALVFLASIIILFIGHVVRLGVRGDTALLVFGGSTSPSRTFVRAGATPLTTTRLTALNKGLTLPLVRSVAAAQFVGAVLFGATAHIAVDGRFGIVRDTLERQDLTLQLNDCTLQLSDTLLQRFVLSNTANHSSNLLVIN